MISARSLFYALLLCCITAVSHAQQGGTHLNRATGSFEVKVVPQKPDNKPEEEAKLGRMSIDKVFQGGLEGTSKGEMLSLMTEVKGSGVYVAIERVTGTLHGRKGSFALHHTGLMLRNTPQLSVTVVPDSGTDELVGLTGSMKINIEGGKHTYEFEYALLDKK